MGRTRRSTCTPGSMSLIGLSSTPAAVRSHDEQRTHAGKKEVKLKKAQPAVELQAVAHAVTVFADASTEMRRPYAMMASVFLPAGLWRQQSAPESNRKKPATIALRL